MVTNYQIARQLKRVHVPKLIVGLLILSLVAAAYVLLKKIGMLAMILEGATFRAWVAGSGAWGPFAIIGLMTLAILASPIPSAPIALAAGAAYGHTWGTIYVLLGAEAGALAAFYLARLLGHDVLRRWFGERLSLGLLGSQNTLMLLVFASQLLPFVSFDLVSYAAGLTVLAFWRFAIATFAGIVPASFLLAHFGSGMATGETERIMISIVALGGITLIPVSLALCGTVFARVLIARKQMTTRRECICCFRSRNSTAANAAIYPSSQNSQAHCAA